MHGLDIIIARNQTPEEQAERLANAKPTLADEAREVIELLGDAPRRSVHEQLLLRFARELIAAGVDGDAEFPQLDR